MGNFVTIPAALQLILDDVGWFSGTFEDHQNGPARTNMPRRHVYEDWVVLDELGKRIGQKIHGMFVIGEWDKWGLLAGVPHATPAGKNWTGSPWFDEAQAEKIRDFVNSAEHLELGLHGLLHDVWTDGGVYPGGSEFFPPKDFVRGNPQALASADYLRAHFDAWFELYRRWGFRGEIRSFVSPRGESGWHLKDELQPLLREYGIRFWANHTWTPRPVGCTVSSGVIFSRKEIALADYAAYDLDPDYLPLYDPASAGIIGGHWPNVLRYAPQNNLRRLDAWADWFARQSEVFGLMISEDIGFAHCQQLCKNFSTLREEGDLVTLDLSAVDAAAPARAYGPVYVSVKKEKLPAAVSGAAISPREEKQAFRTYRLDRIPGEHVIRLTLADAR